MISAYLKQPYPYLVNKWKVISIVSLFIALFLLVLQPLGLNQIPSPYKNLLICGYGVVSFAVLVIDWILIPRLFPSWFAGKNWTVLKQILWQFWVLFSIGMGNYLYSAMLFPAFWGIKGVLFFQIYTCAIGVIPIVSVTIINQNIRLRNNLQQAVLFNEGLTTSRHPKAIQDKITLVADNQKDRFEINVSDLIYIEAAGNYLQIGYRKEDKFAKTLLRNTLQNIETQLNDHPSLEKCHRAYLVNIHQIKGMTGNSQGLKLQMSLGIEIPVSRTFSKQLKSKIETILA